MYSHSMTRLIVRCLWTFIALGSGSGQAFSATPTPIQQVEEIYADLVDAGGVVTTIDSGLFTTYQGSDLAAWEQRYSQKRKQLVVALDSLSTKDLSPVDLHAASNMRESLNSTLPESPHSAASAISPEGHTCDKASQRDLDAQSLRDALNSCFDEVGNSFLFEGKGVSRVSAFALLSQMDDSQRRKTLFFAFAPLWEAINGKNEPDSPYRRRMKFAVADAALHGSAISAAARDIGLKPDEVEHWLEQILDAWRRVTPDQLVEPWDYIYLAAEADRTLASAIPLASLLPVNERYYRDLGADLKNLGVLHDFGARAGKAPLSYTSYVTMGRVINGKWRPTVARVSASYTDSGLDVLNELVHENGHAVHYTAIHNRPAFMDIGDDFFCEAFADVTSWNVYDPAWQEKYLGHEVSESAGLRSQYAMVTLEVAWALFDLRMMNNPDADPNAVWTQITNHYLHIVPHPEYSWWAERVQLVDQPGYMINYGLGAVVTADLRQHIRKSIGPFNAGNARWYFWVSANLLRYGTERSTFELLHEFLGRPVSLEPLLSDIRRLSPRQKKSPTAN